VVQKNLSSNRHAKIWDGLLLCMMPFENLIMKRKMILTLVKIKMRITKITVAVYPLTKAGKKKYETLFLVDTGY